MDREAAIQVLRRNADALRARGVRHAALFGSVARGEAEAGSDVDILIELEPGAAPDMFSYAGLTQYVADLFPGRVDVVSRDSLKPRIRPRVMADAVYAF
jgi:hypothetical protein